MKDNTAYRFRATLRKLHRNPVLTALMVTSLIFGMTASIAGIAMWRAGSACVAQTSAPRNIEQDAADMALRAEQLAHQALQADLVMEAGQIAHGDSTLSRKVASAACPCTASTRWHWQRI